MLSSRDAFEKDACPVGDKLLGDMYRASPEGLAALVETVPPETRAMLALFCYRRSHLHEMAIAIASTCEKRDLVSLGAALGSALYAMSRPTEKKPVIAEASNRRKITLSTKPLSTFAPISDDLDDDDEPATLVPSETPMLEMATLPEDDPVLEESTVLVSA